VGIEASDLNKYTFVDIRQRAESFAVGDDQAPAATWAQDCPPSAPALQPQ
jgi:hypothetical protein